jgi:1,2-phenylacetyl-CoA epoxidase PaaB subunit
MSKRRQQIEMLEGDLSDPVAGDLAAYVIFTQLKDGGPHLYAGWLDAVDHEMAIQFAKEHYGQDQKCVNIWAIPRAALAGTDPEFGASEEVGPRRSFQAFRQAAAGDGMVSSSVVDATSPAEALNIAGAREVDVFHHLWVAPLDDIISTAPDDLIWRYSDQTYRLARGYSRDVREKWQRVRAMRDLEEYEKDDLHETF